IDAQRPCAARSAVLHCGSPPTVALATVSIPYSPVPEIMTDQLAKKSAAWSGRFSEPVSELVKRYTASVGFDQRLAMQDIDGSLAHARMLAARGVLSAPDLAAIEAGMTQIRAEIARGQFEWSVDLEDVHLNIE